MSNDDVLLSEALSSFGLDDRQVCNVDDIDLDGEHKYGYAIVKDGKLIQAIDRTNPNKKWDWYQLGGRWSNHFLLKSGLYCNSALKKDIDFEAMRAKAAESAKKEYEPFSLAMRGYQFPKTWAEMLESKGDQSIQSIRDEYHAQPAHIAVSKSIQMIGCPFEYFGRSMDDFVARKVAGSTSSYAVVIDGQWLSRGEMGWFGISDDELSESEWHVKHAELLEKMPDDALLSMYDCHI